MKKVVLALSLFMFSTIIFAKDIKINVSNLPTEVTTFVKKHYPSAKIKKVTQESDDKDYNLKLSDGTELEFGKSGNLIEVKTKTSIPTNVLPQGIANYVKFNCPGKTVRSFEHSKLGYDIKLSNGKKFQLNNNFAPTSFKEE
ncbi:MAG: PepSY-like domain-containing protein [Prevotella sp.]|nr:PepSY-like domain-containing protein [Prevotella sp.]